MIDERDPVLKMAEVLDTLDYRKLRSSYRRHCRKMEPERLFSVIAYGNMQGIFSCRGMEEACKTDIRFIWLLQYRKAPDRTTIARFLENNMSGCAERLRLKEDHMLNGQLKPACNLQTGVESEYIKGLGLFPNPTDTTTLIPFLESVEKCCGKRHENIIADEGYASQENYAYLEEKG